MRDRPGRRSVSTDATWPRHRRHRQIPRERRPAARARFPRRRIGFHSRATAVFAMRAATAAMPRGTAGSRTPRTGVAMPWIALRCSLVAELRPPCRQGERLASEVSPNDSVMPPMREMHEAELARLAAHDQRALHVVEDAHAFRVGRMRPDPVLAGLERKSLKGKLEIEAMVAGLAERHAVHVRRDAEYRRSIRAN